MNRCEIVTALKDVLKNKSAGTYAIPSKVCKLVQSKDKPESNMEKLILKLTNKIYTADGISTIWISSIMGLEIQPLKQKMSEMSYHNIKLADNTSNSKLEKLSQLTAAVFRAYNAVKDKCPCCNVNVPETIEHVSINFSY
ncbi:hypothetical protein BB561_001592 [Smittium simulii]|uniref:Uncharacterized protein n=1 Tax=Smittium simulii TaxID=133385 RepID=A0A2T9YTZ3_9FUNG|nr:hypothetical protein BB561_001592 [Smittium simulii]